MLLSERIQHDGITIQAGQRDRPPEGELDPSPDMRWWDVTLTLDADETSYGRGFSIPWGIGPAAGDEPDICDVMSLVTMGVRSVINARDYEEWCGEWGFNPDGEGRYETYEEWIRISGRLNTFLGDRFDGYLWDTDDDT